MNAGHATGGTTIDDHLGSLSESARAIMSDLRRFVLSLGDNVIEQSRPHRIVYCKTFNMRVFLEIVPAGDRLLLTMRHGRNDGPHSLELDSPDKLTSTKEAIAAAYERIQ